MLVLKHEFFSKQELFSSYFNYAYKKSLAGRGEQRKSPWIKSSESLMASCKKKTTEKDDQLLFCLIESTITISLLASIFFTTIQNASVL